MGHDPQRLAAAYLGGELRRHRRERFQAHLLECEACWGEVQAARRGRALAESVREIAPHHLRDRIRATVEVAPAGRRRWTVGWAGLAAAVTAAAVLAGGLLVAGRQPTQPATIAAAVASYREGGASWRGPGRPPCVRQLGDLRWRGSGRGTLGGLPVVPTPTRTGRRPRRAAPGRPVVPDRGRRPPSSRQRHLDERGRGGGVVLRRPSGAVAGGRPGPRQGAGGRRPAGPALIRAGWLRSLARSGPPGMGLPA